MRFLPGFACLIVCSACGPLLAGEPGGSDGAGQTDTMPETTGTSSTDATSTSSTSLPDPTTGSGDDTTGCGTACDDDSGQDSLSFVFPCDAAGVGLTHCTPPGRECNPWDQDCPDGEKCTPWANDGGADWTSLRCSPAEPPTGQPGEPCTVEGSAVSGVDTCAVGSMCWHVDPDTLEGTCVAMCTGTPDLPICEDPRRTCAMTNDGVLSVCLPTCDPLLGDCADGEGCYPIAGDATLSTFVCAPTGNGVTIDDRHPTHCAAGTIDVGNDELSTCAVDEEPCCATVCNLEAPMCGDGLTCTAFYDDGELPPDLADIGVCLG